jgi:diacylglycerol O-acyltransferase
MRQWLAERDALPASPLVAMVPISVRHLAVDQSGANRIALTLCTIPTDVDDRRERVAAARGGDGRGQDPRRGQ